MQIDTHSTAQRRSNGEDATGLPCSWFRTPGSVRVGGNDFTTYCVPSARQTPALMVLLTKRTRSRQQAWRDAASMIAGCRDDTAVSARRSHLWR